MDIRLLGTMKQIKETIEFLNEHYTFFYNGELRYRKASPGLPRLNENTEYIADLFDVIPRDEYVQMMQAKGWKKQ